MNERLNERHHLILSTIEGAGQLSGSEVARRIGVDPGRMSEILQPMIRRGLIRLGTSYVYGRGRMLHLTDAGRAAAQSGRADRCPAS